MSQPESHSVTFTGGKGVISPEDFKAYWEVVSDAFVVHLARERVRRALWKDYPARDQYNQIRIKIDRIMRSLEILDQGEIDDQAAQALREEIASETSDIINYATFGVRQL